MTIFQTRLGPQRIIAALVKVESDLNIQSSKQKDMANLQEGISKLEDPIMGHQREFECIATSMARNDDLASGSQSMSSLQRQIGQLDQSSPPIHREKLDTDRLLPEETTPLEDLYIVEDFLPTTASQLRGGLICLLREKWREEHTARRGTNRTKQGEEGRGQSKGGKIYR